MFYQEVNIKELFSSEIHQNGTSNIKEAAPSPRTLQNYYISDPRMKLNNSDQAVLSSAYNMHHIPTVVINVIPFHIALKQTV